MGVEYYLVDKKNKRIHDLGKWYGLSRFFDNHAPFTVEDMIASDDALGTDRYRGLSDEGRKILAGWVVGVCTEADWDVEVVDENTYYDRVYERGVNSPWLGWEETGGVYELKGLTWTE